MGKLQNVSVALLTTAAGLSFSSTGHAAAAPATAPPIDIPAEYLTASETEIPGESDFWLKAITCPEFQGFVISDQSGVSASGDRVVRTCSYYEGDTSTFANYRGGISVDWEKPGFEGSPLFCGYNSGDLGWEVIVADPGLSAQATASFDGFPELAQLAAPLAEAWYEDWARPLAASCDLVAVPDCPPIEGWVRDGFFGPQDRADVSPPPTSDRDSRSITYECNYTEPAASYEEQISIGFDTTVLVPHEQNTPDVIQIACSTGERFGYGTGLIGTGGTHAIRTTYSADTVDPIDLVPLTAAIDTMVGVVSADAITCEGVELLENDPFTPLPAWLEEVFTSDATTTGQVPFASDLEAGGAADEQPAVEPDAEPAPIDTPPDDGTSPAATPVDDQAAPPAAPATGGGSSTIGTLMRIVAIGAIVLTVLMLIVTFLFVRKETRVRPKWDIVRIVVSAIVATVMILWFAASAPLWAVGAAVVLGGGLGVWQGRNLVVRMTERGLFARRDTWAIFAFTVGILITQVAGLLNRTNVFRVGIAMTFFSAALALGLFIGRGPKIRAARVAGALGIAVVFLAPLFAITPSDRTTASTPEPGGQVLSPRPEITEQLIGMADWQTATIDGGLWNNNGKPLLEVELPAGLDTLPDPITRSIAWDDLSQDVLSYDLTETYTFSWRTDGLCCSIDYLAEGARNFDGEVTPITFDAKLTDIQLYSIDGPGRLGEDQGWLPGLPFAEQRYIPRNQERTVSDCHRPVADSRVIDDLAATGGEADIRTEDGLGAGGASNALDVVIGVPCDIPEFNLETALELAPEPPPANAPAREQFQLGNCPVYSEAIGATYGASDFPGVHTETAGRVMFDGNANACGFGDLFGGTSIGEGGRGNTRHEFAMELAQPRQGEWDRGVDVWFPDECCIAPASVTEPPSDDTCDVDESGVPVAPPDLADGGSCSHVSRHQLPQGEIYIETDYDLADGPDTVVRALMPWGSFFYTCHHCEVGNPQIATMLDTIIRAGNGFATDVTYTVAAGDLIVSQDTVQTGTTPPATDEAADTTVPTTEPGEITREEAEDLVDLTLGDDATDAEREAAIAVIIGLIGAGAIGATTLGEAGVGAREVADAWRAGGRQGVNDLIDERNRPTPVANEEEVSVYDPRTGTSTWMTQDEADDFYDALRDSQIAASVAAGRRSGRVWAEAWERAAAAERAAEENARAAAQQGWDEYVRLGDLAINQDRMDILERLSRDESVFDEDGNLDRERLDRLIDMMRDHLWREQAAPDPVYSETGQLIVDVGNSLDEFSRSIPVRIATGMATGGMSEIYHQGRTVVEAVRGAAERSVEWTRDPATGEWRPPQEDFDVLDGVGVALDAAARENIPGYNTAATLLDPNATASDVAGAALWDAIGARMARGELNEAMDQLRRAGGRVRPGVRLTTPDPNLPTIRAQPGDVIAPGPYIPRHGAPDDLSRLARGQVVPDSMIHQTGWTPAQIDHMNRIARANDAIIDARTTNPHSMQLIRSGDALPKPLPVKSKTLTMDDYYAGGCELDDVGKAGYYDPADVTRRPAPADAPPGFDERITARRAERAREVGKYDGYADIDGVEVRNGVVYDVDTGLPYAGDVDAVAFRDRTTGQPLTGERLERAEAMWRNERHVSSTGEVTPPNEAWGQAGAGQHGAEANAAMGVIDSKVQARIDALDPKAPNYLEQLREAQHQGYADARDFQNGLLDNSVGPRANETTLSIDGSGAPRVTDGAWADDLTR